LSGDSHSIRRGAIWISSSNSSPCSPAPTSALFFGLKESFEALFGRKVDLVEPATVRNPYLKAGIERSREPVY